MNIKYFIRTVEGRKVDLPEEYERIIDKEHRYTKSYIDALYKISDYDAVLLEDDIVLCKNFEEEVEKVVKQYPNMVINFFSKPDQYYTTHYSTAFSYNQCTFFPKGTAKILADEIMKMYTPEEKLVRPQRYGSLLYLSLINLSMPHIDYRPTLVQHIDKKSTYDGLTLRRNTPYFKDYLDKIGINMTQAYDKENNKKLYQLLEADRKKWYND